MINNIGQLVQLAMSGGDVRSVLGQIMQGNPQAMQAMRMLDGKTPKQLEQIARSMANERGVRVEDIASRLRQMAGGGENRR